MHAFPIRDLPRRGGQAEPRARDATVVAFPLTEGAGRRRVVVRLLGDDQVEVGRVGERDDALRLARGTIERIEAAAARAQWLEVGDRLLRPDAILSVDVELLRTPTAG